MRKKQRGESSPLEIANEQFDRVFVSGGNQEPGIIGAYNDVQSAVGGEIKDGTLSQEAGIGRLHKCAGAVVAIARARGLEEEAQRFETLQSGFEVFLGTAAMGSEGQVTTEAKPMSGGKS